MEDTHCPHSTVYCPWIAFLGVDLCKRQLSYFQRRKNLLIKGTNITNKEETPRALTPTIYCPQIGFPGWTFIKCNYLIARGRKTPTNREQRSPYMKRHPKKRQARRNQNPHKKGANITIQHTAV